MERQFGAGANAHMTASVDHAVINVLYRMDAAVERFRTFGFTLTERGHHSLGSINHLMMFDTDYLELIGLPHGAARIRREVADSPLGLNGLVFATHDADALHQKLVAQGVAVESPVAFHRPVTIDGVVHRASFRTVRFAPGYVLGGRVYFCEHRTPHLVWRPEWQRHRNGVHGLAAFTIVLAEPAREAEVYARMVGGTPRHLSGDEIDLTLGTFTVRFMSRVCYGERYGNYGCDAAGRDAFMGALSLRTTALARVRECIAAAPDFAHGVAEVQSSPARITVPAACAFNTVLEFVE